MFIAGFAEKQPFQNVIEVKKENGKYYMELSDLSDLKFL